MKVDFSHDLVFLWEKRELWDDQSGLDRPSIPYHPTDGTIGGIGVAIHCKKENRMLGSNTDALLTCCLFLFPK